MASDTFGTSVLGTSRRETVRSKRVERTDLEDVTVALSVGGEVSLSILADVEEHVGPIDRNNEFNVSDKGGYFRVKVYRENKICVVGDCVTTAEQKFDGNWLCSDHLESYTARQF